MAFIFVLGLLLFFYKGAITDQCGHMYIYQLHQLIITYYHPPHIHTENPDERPPRHREEWYCRAGYDHEAWGVPFHR